MRANQRAYRRRKIMARKTTSSSQTFWNWLVTDSHDNVVLWQTPNFPIIAWFACDIIARETRANPTHAGFQLLAEAFLFTWAYLEITKGTSNIRRLLGAVIMVVLLMRFFGQT